MQTDEALRCGTSTQSTRRDECFSGRRVGVSLREGPQHGAECHQKRKQNSRPNPAQNPEKVDTIDVTDGRWTLKARNLRKSKSVSDYPAYSLAR